MTWPGFSTGLPQGGAGRGACCLLPFPWTSSVFLKVRWSRVVMGTASVESLANERGPPTGFAKVNVFCRSAARLGDFMCMLVKESKFMQVSVLLFTLFFSGPCSMSAEQGLCRLSFDHLPACLLLPFISFGPLLCSVAFPRFCVLLFAGLLLHFLFSPPSVWGC